MKKMTQSSGIAIVLAGTAISNASAAESVGETQAIVVTAPRLKGSAVGDIPPEVTLDSADIQSLGASTVAELIGLLSTQTRSGQGRGGEAPVVLLDGRRISGFAEVRDLPPEAVARVEILPEEVALKYGYAATQRVVNIVIVDRFKAITSELEPRFATGIKRADFNQEFSLVQIDKGGRFTFDLQHQTAEALPEALGGILGSGPEAPFRTLLPKTKQFTANAVLSRPVADSVLMTLNGRLDLFDSDAGIGLASDAATPLVQRVRVITSHAGVTLGGDVSRWRWAFTAGYDRIENRTVTDRSATTVDFARSTAATTALDFTMNGSLFTLPSGPVAASISGGTQMIHLDRAIRLGNTPLAGTTSRNTVTGGLNIDVPVVSRRRSFWGAIGELSVNANFSVQKLSDLGTMTTRGVGARWEPTKPLSFLVSVTDEDGAPTPQQLGSPTISTPNVNVFDYVRGETATITRIDGGNRALTVDTRHIFKVEGALKPLAKTDLALSASYVSSRTRGPIAGFPVVTSDVEAAFPGRIARDAVGRLISVDARPVNFANAARSEIRWGLSYSQSLGKDRTPVVPRVPGGGTFGGGRYFGANGSRLQISLFHTVHLTDRMTIRAGLPLLDLLNGAAIGSRGGQPRHEIELSGSASKNGFGLRFNGSWQSATTVESLDKSPAKTLRFGPIGTLNLRFFAFPARQPKVVERLPWLAGVRFLVAIDNLFDTRQDVTDGAGATPLRYQSGYLDPLGRTVRLSIRKSFF